MFIYKIFNPIIHFTKVDNLSNSVLVKLSLYSSLTCHRPLALILSFGDLLPNQFSEGLISPD